MLITGTNKRAVLKILFHSSHASTHGNEDSFEKKMSLIWFHGLRKQLCKAGFLQGQYHNQSEEQETIKS